MTNNVIKQKFSESPYGQLSELYSRLRDVVYDYEDEVSTASVIGVLEFLKSEIIEEAKEKNT
jgi:hypothetical protein